MLLDIVTKDQLIAIAGILVFAIVIIWLIRETLCWYWKITEMTKNQKEQIRLLKKIAGEEEIKEKSEETESPKHIITTLLAIIAICCSIYAHASDTTIYDSASICSSDSIFLGGNWQNTPGTYYDSLISITGYDSVIVTTLTVYSADSSTQSASICEDDSMFLGGAWQTMTGIYYDTYVSSNGCDSIMITTLIVDNCTGIEDIGFDDPGIYPNPTTGIINIDTKESISFEINNCSGQVIYSNQFDNEIAQIDLSGHADGIYIIRLRNDNAVQIKKLILLHP